MGSGIEMSARRFAKAYRSGDKTSIEQASVELCTAVAYADTDGDRELIDRYRANAEDLWDRDDNQIEIDADAVVSLDESGGAFVQAWVWVGVDQI
ncbi:MAG: hypothetical protein GKR90_13590 [Pseudomonadales bacterium]|nr:hypothetical protein [Pseudomonadales bacterium]